MSKKVAKAAMAAILAAGLYLLFLRYTTAPAYGVKPEWVHEGWVLWIHSHSVLVGATIATAAAVASWANREMPPMEWWKVVFAAFGWGLVLGAFCLYHPLFQEGVIWFACARNAASKMCQLPMYSFEFLQQAGALVLVGWHLFFGVVAAVAALPFVIWGWFTSPKR